MRLLDTYATNTGSKIDKPFIFSKFFPLPCEKYITIQAQTPYDSRNYAYWQDVIDFIHPILQKQGIHIIQVGLKDEIPLNKTINLLGKTSINHLAYVVQNSLLHFGADSFCVHLASHFDIPIVSIYSISNPSVAGPHFGDKNKHILIKGYENVGNKKPSYSQVENPKSINTIKPEQIIKGILNLLNIDQNSYKLITSKYFGKRYNDTLIETLPNQVISQNFFAGHVLNIRFDYAESNDISHTMQNLAIRKCCIITDKSVSVGAFMQFKENLSAVIYDVTNKVDVQFVKYLNDIGVKYICVFNKNKNKEISVLDRRFELMEYCDVIEFNTIPDDLPNFEDDLKFKTKRILLANQKVYTSRAAQLQDLPITDLDNLEQNLADIKDKELFLEDVQYCYIYS